MTIKKFMSILFINLFLLISLNSYLPKYLNNQDLDKSGIRQLKETVELMDSHSSGPMTRSRFKRLPENQQFLFKLDMSRHKVSNRYNKDGEIDSFYLDNLKDRDEEDIVCDRVLSLVDEYFSSDDVYIDYVFVSEVLPNIVSYVVDDEYVGLLKFAPNNKVREIRKKNIIQAFLDRWYRESQRRPEFDRYLQWLLILSGS